MAQTDALPDGGQEATDQQTQPDAGPVSLETAIKRLHGACSGYGDRVEHCSGILTRLSDAGLDQSVFAPKLEMDILRYGMPVEDVQTRIAHLAENPEAFERVICEYATEELPEGAE
jgi:hypothetical protein